MFKQYLVLQTKFCLFALIFIIGILASNAQQFKLGKKINAGYHPQVLLELEDSTQALLLTRVDTPSKVFGNNAYRAMLVYDSVQNHLTYYDNTTWQYIPKYYNLSFDANGGTGSMSEQLFIREVLSPLKKNTLIPPMGKVFAGWAISPIDANNVVVAYTDEANLLFYNSTTLYAAWANSTYTISFDKTEGSGSMLPQTFSYSVAQNLNANTFLPPTGKSFAGWATTLGGHVAYINMQSYTIGAGDAILYAVWIADVPYNISFDANGGTGTMSSQTFSQGVAQVLNPNTFTAPIGKSFAGWATTPNGNVAYENMAPYIIGASDVVLYAVWATNAYNVTFDINTGNLGSMPIQAFAYNIPQNLNANTFSKTGHVFAGWGITATGPAMYADRASYTTTAHAILYAQWTPRQDTIKFDMQGGSGGISQTIAIYGSPMPTAIPIPTRAGYAFGGYYDNINGTGTRYYTNTMSSALNWNKTTTTTLYAKWTATPYSVVLNVNGGNTSSSPSTIWVTYNENMPTATAPRRTGYTFMGYFDDPTIGGTKYYDADMSSAHVWDKNQQNDTLYARWELSYYTITFDLQGGIGGVTDVTVIYGDNMPIATPPPTKAGYIFNGYFDAPSGTGTQYYNAMMASTRTWNKTANATLYAHWSGNSNFTVTFNVNGGGSLGIPTSVIATLNADMPTPVGKPSRLGYTFVGYYDVSASTGGNEYYDANMNSSQPYNKTANATLYARWAPNAYTITFDANGGTGTMPNQTIVYGTTASLIANLYSSTEDSVFAGWATTKTNADNWIINYKNTYLYTMGATNTTLYAVWLHIPMVKVPAGSFQMGSTIVSESASPIHTVTLSPYSIGKYEVSQRLWKAVMAPAPNPSFNPTNDFLPVEQVSWNMTKQFLDSLNKMTGRIYKLPTEAQWEYAARGGSPGDGTTYSGSNNINDVAWYMSNSGGKTQKIGTKRPNGLGIYDMSGNVIEWCSDWTSAYTTAPQVDPTGPATGTLKIIRGGAYGGGTFGGSMYCTVSIRTLSYYSPGTAYSNIGFRLCLQ